LTFGNTRWGSDGRCANQPGTGEYKKRHVKMKIERNFTKKSADAYGGIEFVTTSSEIKNTDGTVVFSLENIEMPATW